MAIGLAFARMATVGAGTLLTLNSSGNSSPRVVSVWGGAMTQMILESDGSVWAWGANNNGQLGNGTTNNTYVPTRVVGPGGVGYFGPASAIMGGEAHNFALKPDGTVWCWGANNSTMGLLGNGTTSASAVPVQASNLTSTVSLGGRGYHSLAIKSNGTVWAWGWNSKGELGNGTANATLVPVQVVGLTNPAVVTGGLPIQFGPDA